MLYFAGKEKHKLCCLTFLLPSCKKKED